MACTSSFREGAKQQDQRHVFREIRMSADRPIKYVMAFVAMDDSGPAPDNDNVNRESGEDDRENACVNRGQRWKKHFTLLRPIAPPGMQPT